MPRAYAFTELGGPEVESFIERPRQVPGPGQLLIRVRAAGVNPVDCGKALRAVEDGHTRGKIVIEFGA